MGDQDARITLRAIATRQPFKQQQTDRSTIRFNVVALLPQWQLETKGFVARSPRARKKNQLEPSSAGAPAGSYQMACVIAPPYEAFMLLKLFAPISPFGLIPVLQRSFATLSMIPRLGVTRGGVRPCLRGRLPATGELQEAVILAPTGEVDLDPLSE